MGSAQVFINSVCPAARSAQFERAQGSKSGGNGKRIGRKGRFPTSNQNKSE